MSAEETVSEVKEILENVAESNNLKSYELEFDENVVRGNGFLGEFFFGSVINKDTNEKTNVAIKKAYKAEKLREIMNVQKAYVVENHFYSVVFPELDKFQKDKLVHQPFSSIPKYFFGVMEPFKEAVVMENIKLEGYDMHDKFQPLEQNKLEAIFREYGKFHALSFAYKDQNNEEFKKITNVYDYFDYLANSQGFNLTINSICKEIYEALDKTSSNGLLAAFKPYAEDAGAIFKEYCQYQGEYYGVLHGDCWSNNLMFKYDESGNIESIRMLDFQMSRCGTPVNDLSYFFYAGGSKADFERLDKYLDIYHKSFCDFTRELGSDPELLYPLSSLKEDWKKYARFGIIMSLMLVMVRLMDTEKIADFTASSGKEDTFSKITFDRDLFIQRGVDVVVHAYEKKFL